MRRHDPRQDGIEAVEQPEPPAPAVIPGSLEWASAVGNQAVARLAAENQEEEPAEEAPVEEPAPAEAELAEVDEEQLPE